MQLPENAIITPRYELKITDKLIVHKSTYYKMPRICVVLFEHVCSIGFDEDSVYIRTFFGDKYDLETTELEFKEIVKQYLKYRGIDEMDI